MTTKAYFKSLRAAIDNIDHAELQKAIDVLADAQERNAQVFIFGNGGSAATAMHFANDLVKMCGIRAQSLTNVSILTAWANDMSYAMALRAYIHDAFIDGDVAIGISCSGESENVLNAIAIGKGHGTAIALTGNNRRDNPITEVSDICIHAPHEDIKAQEDIHLMICHAIAGELSK